MFLSTEIQLSDVQELILKMLRIEPENRMTSSDVAKQLKTIQESEKRTTTTKLLPSRLIASQSRRLELGVGVLLHLGGAFFSKDFVGFWKN